MSFRPVVEVEEAESDVESDLKKRIALMEEEEKLKIEEHVKKVSVEKEEEESVKQNENKLNGTFNNFDGSAATGLPKYQELFKAPKLPPLPSSMATASQGPPLPQTNFQEIPQPAASVVPPAPKPIFPSQQQEVKVPQPAQLVKKKEEVTPKPADAKAVADKMDYDKLFGN